MLCSNDKSRSSVFQVLLDERRVIVFILDRHPCPLGKSQPRPSGRTLYLVPRLIPKSRHHIEVVEEGSVLSE